MARRKFEIIKISFKAVFMGSIVTPWLIILGDYISTNNLGDSRWFYSCFSWLEIQAFCIPVIGYSLPAYLLINFIFKFLLNQKLLRFNFLTYTLTGLMSHLIGSILFFISSITYDLKSLLFSFIVGIPSLVIYLLFFKRLENHEIS